MRAFIIDDDGVLTKQRPTARGVVTMVVLGAADDWTLYWSRTVPAIDEAVDHVVISAYVEARMPDRALYEHALGPIVPIAADMVPVDDEESPSVEVARLGVRAIPIYFTDTESSLTALADLRGAAR
jgi:hypothetical protein